MKAKKVYEAIGDYLKPRGVSDVINAMKDLSVSEKIKTIKEMRHKWKDLMYDKMLDTPEILDDIQKEIKREIDDLDILKRIDYIEQIEKELPNVFDGLRNKKTLDELRDFITNRPFEEKVQLVWKFFKTWPDLFKDVTNDKTIDPETNKILLLFKIKDAINDGNIERLEGLITEMGNKYGRKNILDDSLRMIVSDRGYNQNRLFNRKDLEQLKLSLYKETRTEEESLRDEYTDVYAFVGYPDFVKTDVGYDKKLGIENLIKLDKYSSSSLAQVPMMKIRAKTQYPNDGNVWGVYIPKYMWNKDKAYNDEIPDNIRTYIDTNKFVL